MFGYSTELAEECLIPPYDNLQHPDDDDCPTHANSLYIGQPHVVAHWCNSSCPPRWRLCWADVGRNRSSRSSFRHFPGANDG